MKPQELTQQDVRTLVTDDGSFLSISDLILVLKTHEKKDPDIEVDALCKVLLELMHDATRDPWDH